MCLQFGLIIFWQKEIDTKADCKMLLKLTTGFLHFHYLRLQEKSSQYHSQKRRDSGIDDIIFGTVKLGRFFIK